VSNAPPFAASAADDSTVTLEQLSRAWLRQDPPFPADALDNYLPPWQLELSFASQAMNATIPALLTYDVIFGATPYSSGLDYLTAYANQLEQVDGYSVHNTYIKMGSEWAEASSFAAQWSAMTPQDFVDTMYRQIFGTTPTAGAEAWLIHDVQYYTAEFGSDIAGKGGTIGGMLALKTQMPYAAGPDYVTAAAAVLHADALGQAQWGKELIAAYQ
jgi:hypothetical protein